MSSRRLRILTVLLTLVSSFVLLISVVGAQAPGGDDAIDPDADKGKPNPPTVAFNPGPSGRAPGNPVAPTGTFIPTPPQCASIEVSASRSNAITIPNTGTPLINSTLFVAFEVPYIWDMRVSTPLSHTFPGDIDMTLTSPDGRVSTLTTDNGAGNDNVYANAVWDDFANPGGVLPYTTNNGLVTDHVYANNVGIGLATPEESFGGFVGEGTGTTWTLTINDDANQDGGVLNGWGLAFLALNEAPNLIVKEVSNETVSAIPDTNSVFTSQINVAGSIGMIQTVELTALISHTNNSDLDITLTSPDGRVATLTTDNGGTFDNVFVDTTWADRFSFSGALPYTNTPALTTDRSYANNVNASGLVPEESMSMFRGGDADGTWTLTIVDDTPGNTGTLNGWGLTFITATCEDIAPDIDVSVTSLEETHDPAPTTSFQTFTVSNLGSDTLNFSVSESATSDVGRPLNSKAEGGAPSLGSGSCGGANVPWLEVEGGNEDFVGGGVEPGGSVDVSLFFKSFGLNDGVYTTTLCLESNDPDENPVLIPLTLNVDNADPNITLDATVGTTAGACAGTDTIAVTTGTDVFYCYTVNNTGDITLPLHDLEDTVLGPIFEDLAVDLGPGESVSTVDAGLELSATIATTTTNTGDWTAFEADPYAISVSSANFINIAATGTAVLTDSDDASITQTLDFPFTYFGTEFNEVCLSSNGHLRFGNGDGCTRFDNDLLPVSDYDGVVAPYWDDMLIPDAPGSAILVETQGTTPNRVFIAQWNNVRHFDGEATDLGTYQVRLQENGDITFAYDDVDFGDPTRSNGALATVAIEAVGEFDARIFSFNEAEIDPLLQITFSPGQRYLVNVDDSTTVNIVAAAPEVSVDPGSLSETHNTPPQTTQQTFDIDNTGDAPLLWELFEDSTSLGGECTPPTDQPWLSATPTKSTTAPGGTTTVTVTFDSTGLDAGVYTANFCLISNDSDEGLLLIPVTLTVVEPTAVTLSTLSAAHTDTPIAVFAATGLLLAVAGLLVWRRR